jgi:hypothetical protein
MVDAVRVDEMDDAVHISGLGFGAANTLCGITDVGQNDPVDETPNCGDCIELYESIKNHRPRFKFK